MPNLQQAPELKYNGEKSISNQFYQIPQELADIIFKELGNSSAQLRIMMVLIGTREGFKISEKWILERTGLQHASYITARKALVNRGWLTLAAAQDIIVNFNAIRNENRGNTILPGNTTLPHGGNTILPQPSNTILPITDKRTDNITNNIEVVSAASADTPSEKYPECTLSQAKSAIDGYVELGNGLIKFNATGKICRLLDEQ